MTLSRTYRAGYRNKIISKLAGVAPLARDSGKYQGKRAIRGGRSRVREILFIVASVVGRHEPDFIAFQLRLAAAGKPRKVIRIALGHKLLVRLDAKARQVRQQQNISPATRSALGSRKNTGSQPQPGLWESGKRLHRLPPFP